MPNFREYFLFIEKQTTLIIALSGRRHTNEGIKIWFPGLNTSLDAFKAVSTFCHVPLSKYQ
jgi:hypothetical protein